MSKYSTNIGFLIKELRKKREMTLKDLSTACNLSVGFLSQLERGMTSIAIDSLEIIAHSLGVELEFFFDFNKKEEESKLIVRSYNRDAVAITDKIIQHNLSSNTKAYNLYPRLIDIMPFTDNGSYNLQLYSHEGEEFIFVLEGVLTLNLEDEEFILYPGDSTTFNSTKPHNWKNETNCITKIICVHNPNPFKEL